MRFGKQVVCIVLGMACALAQSDRGTITGTVTDPSGAVLANASIEARSSQTGAVYTGGSTNTGNYNISQLPTGTYTLTVTASGLMAQARPSCLLWVE